MLLHELRKWSLARMPRELSVYASKRTLVFCNTDISPFSCDLLKFSGKILQALNIETSKMTWMKKCLGMLLPFAPEASKENSLEMGRPFLKMKDMKWKKRGSAQHFFIESCFEHCSLQERKMKWKHVETSSWTPLSWFISFLHHTESLTEHVETFLHVFSKWSFASIRGQMQVHAHKIDGKTIWKMKWKTSVPRAWLFFVESCFQHCSLKNARLINGSMQRYSSLTSFSQSWLKFQ